MCHTHHKGLREDIKIQKERNMTLWVILTWRFCATNIVYAATKPICDNTMDPRIKYRIQGPYSVPPMSEKSY